MAEQGERLGPGIIKAVVHECIEQRSGLGHVLGVDIHMRDHKNLTRPRVLTARIHGAREQITRPLIQRSLQQRR